MKIAYSFVWLSTYHKKLKCIFFKKKCLQGDDLKTKQQTEETEDVESSVSGESELQVSTTKFSVK